MTRFRDSDEFRRGRDGEQVVARWLQKRECYIIPSYDYSGDDGSKAPKLQGLWGGHPVPDLDCSRNGHRFWVEVKTKGYSPIWERAPGGPKHTHGIEVRLLEHYQTVQLISGCPCYLFIFEESSGWLLAERLDVLGKPVSIGSDGRGKKIAYWFRQQFRQLDRLPARDDDEAALSRPRLLAKKVCEGACIAHIFTLGWVHGKDKRTPARRQSHPASPPASVPHPGRGRRAGRQDLRGLRHQVRPQQPVLHRERQRQAAVTEGRPGALRGARPEGGRGLRGRRQ